MRIGCLALRAPTGIGFEMETVMQQLEKEHEIFVLGFPHHEMGYPEGWDRLNLTRVNDPIKASNKQIISWIRENSLDLVLSKENTYNHDFFKIAKFMGVLTVASIDPECFDYYHPRWQYCDLIICLTHHAVEFVKEKGFHNVAYLPLWGLDLDYFRFIKRKTEKTVNFIHNAGYFSFLPIRKGIKAVLIAFDLASRKYDNINLTVYTQQKWNKYPQELQLIAKYNDRIEIVETGIDENIEKFRDNYSLYEKGDIAIQPSKWEGQGAPIVESLAMGLPVITTDAAPMNEFVQNDRGMLVKVKSVGTIDFMPNPEYKIYNIDYESLLQNIEFFAENPNQIEPRSGKAREFVEKYFGLDITQKRWFEIIENISFQKNNINRNIIDSIKLIYYWYAETKVIIFLKKNIRIILTFFRIVK